MNSFIRAHARLCSLASRALRRSPSTKLVESADCTPLAKKGKEQLQSCRKKKDLLESIFFSDFLKKKYFCSTIALFFRDSYLFFTAFLRAAMGMPVKAARAGE